MYYSEAIKIWGFIAHLPIAIVFLMFLSRQIEKRDKGEPLSLSFLDKENKKILNKFATGGIIGLIVLVTFSPISRFLII